jgi:Zn-dependent protease
MRDPFLWSIPLGRLFGITIRVHILYPVVAVGLILRVAFQQKPAPYPEGTWIDVAILTGLLLVSVLAHEFGHCFAARRMQGDASEVLIWPLGGLANVDVPHTPRAHFVTAAAGPAVDLLICVVCALLLAFTVDPGYQPPWNPLWYPFRDDPDLMKLDSYQKGAVALWTWAGGKQAVAAAWPVFLARMFWLNWILFWLNIILVGYPMDAGRMLQAALWPHLGYRQATLAVIFTGFVTMFVVALVAIFTNEILTLCLAGFIYLSCRNQWIILETGGEEGLFGYDFSQGYTSLERDQPPPTPTVRRVSWWQRWLQKRAARKVQRQQETREAEERRLDELLEKVQRQGLTALTDEERRFMKRVSDRYRNRH